MKNVVITSLVLTAMIACSSANGDKTTAQTPPAPVANSAPVADQADPVAKVNGEAITLADFKKEAGASIVAAEIAVYEAKKQALDKMITDRLLDSEAKKVGLEVEDYLRQEIEAKTEAPTDGEIEAFYNERKAQMPQPLEQMKPQLLEHLTNEKRRGTFMTFIEDLKKNAGVETFLSPYRVKIDAGKGYRKGPANAAIEIIEFSDFQCPYCTRANETVNEVLSHYGDKVSVVFRHFPLSFHADAHLASQGAECAGEQGKFWEFHDMLFANQQALKAADMSGYATSLQLDIKEFDSCVSVGTHAEKVDNDMAAGSAVGMNGTPGFYINGIPLVGAVPFDMFKEVIDAELARLK
jgi:protein-disulfide isomerase